MEEVTTPILVDEGRWFRLMLAQAGAKIRRAHDEGTQTNRRMAKRRVLKKRMPTNSPHNADVFSSWLLSLDTF